ncbi:fatty-acyl-CoA synthase [Mumia flava]|uniref:Fatty-acyl-CoA synthase n=1 Tax=Mumia flava TaxID=1348852 RepID=A0A0B2AZE0_9ACTN|nr:AMP-binding protein [Mumia flava]PJJ56966.1 fatty-acyl-CoA synthase [Mumia flava]
MSPTHTELDVDATGAHTIGRWLADRAARTPDATAIDYLGVTASYTELDRRSRDLAAALLRSGYRAGDRVATVTGNSPDHVVAFFACAHAGLALVPMSWRSSPRELEQLLTTAQPSLVLYEDEYSALAHDAVRRLGTSVPTAMLGPTGVETDVPTPAGAATTPGTRPPSDTDPLLVIFTSGSTGSAKGVVLSHEACFWNNLALGQAVELTSSDVVLVTLPQFHVAAWNIQPLLAWRAGARVVLERSFQPGRVLRLIAERRVTMLMGVPTQYRMLADDPAFATTDLSGLRVAMVGGSPMPTDLWQRWADRGVAITQGYGLTEAGPNVLVLHPGDAPAHPGAVGRPYPYVEVALRDPATGAHLSGAATGELCVRGPSTFTEYLHAPAPTAAAFDAGWLRTGDLAERDADGFYRIVDRLKDVYISGGENIAPAEIEQAIVEHPLVAEVAVVGVPDDVWGEVGAAFVVPRSGAALSPDEIRTYLRGALAAFKIPKYVHVHDALPRTALGKVVRPRLRDLAHGSAADARPADPRAEDDADERS